MPVCVLTVFQILTSFGNRVFQAFDAIKNSFLLWVHKCHATLRANYVLLWFLC